MSRNDEHLDESPSALEVLEVDQAAGGDPVIAERLDLGFDVEAIRAQVLAHVVSLPAAWQTNVYGGWSVLSQSGSYMDGWQQGHRAFRADGSRDPAVAGAIHEQRFVTPTEICVGPLAAAIARITGLGFQPYRARIAVLKAGSSSSRHRDDVDGAYRVRLHIPIITNPGCAFVTDHGEIHMPADGAAYLVNVAQWHTVVNRGTADRYHLYMGVIDTMAVSEHFPFMKRPFQFGRGPGAPIDLQSVVGAWSGQFATRSGVITPCGLALAPDGSWTVTLPAMLSQPISGTAREGVDDLLFESNMTGRTGTIRLRDDDGVRVLVVSADDGSIGCELTMGEST